MPGMLLLVKEKLTRKAVFELSDKYLECNVFYLKTPSEPIEFKTRNRFLGLHKIHCGA